MITHVSGAVLATALTPGNWDDRRVAPALCAQTAGGVVLGGAGCGGEEAFERVLSGVRERVETTLRQVWGRFCDHLYARSWAGL